MRRKKRTRKTSWKRRLGLVIGARLRGTVVQNWGSRGKICRGVGGTDQPSTILGISITNEGKFALGGEA